MAKLTTFNFFRKCRAIVRHLPNWRYNHFSETENNEYSIELLGPDKAKLCLYLNYWSSGHNRICVYGKYVNDTRTDTITLRANRSSKDIARDIKRRVIDDYFPIHIVKKLEHEQQRNQYSESDAFHDLLLKLGFKPAQTSYRNEYKLVNDTLQIEQRYDGDYSVNITKINPDVLIKLFYFMKEQKQ